MVEPELESEAEAEPEAEPEAELEAEQPTASSALASVDLFGEPAGTLSFFGDCFFSLRS